MFTRYFWQQLARVNRLITYITPISIMTSDISFQLGDIFPSKYATNMCAENSPYTLWIVRRYIMNKIPFIYALEMGRTPSLPNNFWERREMNREMQNRANRAQKTQQIRNRMMDEFHSQAYSIFRYLYATSWTCTSTSILFWKQFLLLKQKCSKTYSYRHNFVRYRRTYVIVRAVESLTMTYEPITS